MQLLVSVADASEAQAAVAGGADIVDAKNPRHGSLGAVPAQVLHAIHARVGSRTRTSAALGDQTDAAGAALAARMAGDAGMDYGKMGFRGASSAAQVRRVAAAAGPAGCGMQLVLVAYADWAHVGAPEPRRVLEAAVAVRAAGVLMDTVIKGPTLLDYLTSAGVAEWISLVHEAGLLAAVAGSLGASDLVTVRDAGADLAGVRGAACDGGRSGRVSRARVEALSAALRGAPV